MTRRKTSFVVTFALVVAVGAAASLTSAADKAVLRLRAFTVNMSGTGGPPSGATLDIVIERWSTDAEREKLRGLLIEKGSDALLRALQGIKPRAGYIRPSNSLGWDIQYARERPSGDGGRQVILATDRPMSYWELTSRPRSAEYEFTLAEIRLNKDGKGEGKLAPAAKISWDADTRTIEIENYGMEPVRLTDVQVQEAKK
jgi:hypothetical protein